MTDVVGVCLAFLLGAGCGGISAWLLEDARRALAGDPDE